MPDQYSFEDGPELVALRGHWDLAVKSLGERLPATTMAKFIQQLEPAAMEQNTAVLVATSVFVQDWVKDKYIECLADELSAAAGRRLKVDLRVKAKDRTRSQESLVVEPSHPKPVSNGADIPAFLPNTRQTFDTFVLGGSNRLAGAGAIAVGDHPGSKYNPLFIYSKPGLGKTHLLNAIAHRILRTNPQLGVAYMTGQRFTEDFVTAVQSNRVENFRRMIRNAGVWLLDDVQFIVNREKTQEEVFHVFNHLHSLGRQIVVCADRPPRDLLGAHERLRSRFEMGLVVDMTPPDTETRTAILLKKAEQEGILLSPAVALCIAESVAGNVRHLEGALNKVIATASLEGCEPSVDLARDICDKHFRNIGPARPTFVQIVEAVGRHCRVNPDEILGVSRKAQIAHARHVAIYIAREILGDSWKHIGASFGDKDHTTMMHGYRKIREMMDRDRDLSASINGLIQDLYPET